MNISSTTGNSTASYSAVSSTASSLEKQLSSLQAELKKVNDSKDDQATKDKKAQVIQQQIQQLQQEIAKQKAEASTNKAGGQDVNANANVNAPMAVTGPVANSDRTLDVRV
ncbi:FlxA-like family protein [Paenibacillus paridis]|uniref:FlxA-like family protein n=1 Tax=Paenibacillus paridis TaxID=2583376 RepID=UPI00111D0FB4|nr:FlxA-like family protein [Paenibacillus paridis]